MIPKKNNSLRGLSIVHLALLITQIAFAVISVIVVAGGVVIPSQKDLNTILQVVAIAVAAAGYFIGTNRFKKTMQQLREGNETAQHKFNKYKEVSIFLWATIEGPCLFCIISFLITGNYAFIALAGVLTFLLFIFGPNRHKLSLFLGLSDYEIDNLE